MRHPFRSPTASLSSCLLACTVALALGCETDLPEATEIRDMRILGARVEVVDPDEPERATPRPGETFRISLATVFPTQEESTNDSQTLLIGCTAPERYTGGLPICREFIDALRQGTDAQAVADALDMSDVEEFRCSDLFPAPQVTMGGVTIQCINGPPQAEFLVRDDFDADEFLYRGVVCQEGEALIDFTNPAFFSCDDNEGRTILVHGLVPVAHQADDENHNPDLEAAEFRFDGRPWPPVDPATAPPDTNCRTAADDEIVLIADPLSHVIDIRYPADARESDAEGDLETLEFATYATKPELERRFTLFRPEEPSSGDTLRAELEWDPPSGAPVADGGSDQPEGASPRLAPGGSLVRFYFTVRDRRGGFDIATRAVCARAD